MSDTRPQVTDSTARLYDGLPEFYRTADAPTGYALLRFLSLTGDLLGQVEDLADRIDVPDDAPPGTVSDLVNPETADAGWLPWLTQLVGARLAPPATIAPGGMFGSATYGAGVHGAADPTAATPSAYTEAQRRAAIRNAAGGRYTGTVDSIAAAARTALSYKAGGGYVTVTRVPGDPYRIRVRTTPEETPDPFAVLAAVEALGARPAGHVLEYSSYALPWSLLESRYSSWKSLEANAPTWSLLESTL